MGFKLEQKGLKFKSRSPKTPLSHIKSDLSITSLTIRSTFLNTIDDNIPVICSLDFLQIIISSCDFYIDIFEWNLVCLINNFKKEICIGGIYNEKVKVTSKRKVYSLKL